MDSNARKNAAEKKTRGHGGNRKTNFARVPKQIFVTKYSPPVGTPVGYPVGTPVGTPVGYPVGYPWEPSCNTLRAC